MLKHNLVCEFVKDPPVIPVDFKVTFSFCGEESRSVHIFSREWGRVHVQPWNRWSRGGHSTQPKHTAHSTQHTAHSHFACSWRGCKLPAIINRTYLNFWPYMLLAKMTNERTGVSHIQRLKKQPDRRHRVEHRATHWTPTTKVNLSISHQRENGSVTPLMQPTPNPKNEFENINIISLCSEFLTTLKVHLWEKIIFRWGRYRSWFFKIVFFWNAQSVHFQEILSSTVIQVFKNLCSETRL